MTRSEALKRLLLRVVHIPFLPGPEIYDLVRTFIRSQENVDSQVQEATAALEKSSTLIANLQNVLKERQTKLRELQMEYDRVTHLAALTKPQAEAVASSLEKVLGQTQVRERIYSFAINIIAGLIIFAVGVFASDWVKGLGPGFFGPH